MPARKNEPSLLQCIIKINPEATGLWGPINGKWLFDVYIIERDPEESDEEKFREVFLD